MCPEEISDSAREEREKGGGVLLDPPAEIATRATTSRYTFTYGAVVVYDKRVAIADKQTESSLSNCYTSGYIVSRPRRDFIRR